MRNGASGKCITFISVFALAGFGSIWFGAPATGQMNSGRPASGRRVSASTAVNRSANLYSQYAQDHDKSHLTEAIDLLKRSHGSKRDQVVVAQWLGFLYLEAGDYAAAEAPLRDAVAGGAPATSANLDLGVTLDHLNKYADAEIALRAAAKSAASEATTGADGNANSLILRHIYFELGAVLIREGKSQEAVQTLQAADAITKRITAPATDANGDGLNARLRSYAQKDPARIQRALVAAFRKTGNYDAAAEAQRRLMSLPNSDETAGLGLAESYQAAASHLAISDPARVQALQRAAEAYSKALEAMPNNKQAHAAYASVLASLERYPEAAAEFSKADDSSASASVLFNHGVTLVNVDPNPRAGIALLEKSAAADPNRAATFQWLGYARLKDKDYEGAVEALKRAATLDPNVAQTHLSLGTAYINAGQLPAGLASFEQAARIDPNSAVIQYALAEAQSAAGNYAASAVSYTKARDLLAAPQPRSHVTYGEASFGSLTREHIDNALGLAYEKQQMYDQAIAAYEDAAGSGAAAQAAKSVARVRYKLTNPNDGSGDSGHLAAAADSLKRAVEMNPKDSALLAAYGDVLVRQQKYAEAVEPLRLALELRQGSGRNADLDTTMPLYIVHEAYAEALRHLGRNDEAITELKTAIPDDPTPYEAQVVLGALYQKKGDAAEGSGNVAERDAQFKLAVEQYMKALGTKARQTTADGPRFPPPAELRGALAPLQYLTGQYAAAAETAEQILSAEPGNLNAAMVRYRFLREQRHDVNAARTGLATVLAKSPAPSTPKAKQFRAAALNSAAYLYLNPPSRPNLHQAAVYYRESLALNPNASAWNSLGVIEIHRKNYREAVTDVKHAMGINPQYPHSRYNLAIAYQHLGADGHAIANNYRVARRLDTKRQLPQIDLKRQLVYSLYGFRPKEEIAGKVFPIYHPRSAPAYTARINRILDGKAGQKRSGRKVGGRTRKRRAH